MDIIYILECIENKYYIGKTSTDGIKKRIRSHLKGTVQWTRKYPVKKVLDILPCIDPSDEDKQVKLFMDKYGIENVRGGSYSQVNLTDEQIDHLRDGIIQYSISELRTIKNTCFWCNKKGHYIKRCFRRKKSIMSGKDLLVRSVSKSKSDDFAKFSELFFSKMNLNNKN
jgi:hypothetical protein